MFNSSSIAVSTAFQSGFLFHFNSQYWSSPALNRVSYCTVIIPFVDWTSSFYTGYPQQSGDGLVIPFFPKTGKK
ncbi:MAG: hypothetical protein ACFFD4_05965 [Candidatus Odinarchaeota archaeon]